MLLGVEILVRASWMSVNRDFNAYMILTSWMTVFWMGTALGRRFVSDPTLPLSPPLSPALRRCLAVVGCVAMMGGWLWLVERLGIDKSNPFGRIAIGGTATTAITTSAAVTLLYVVYTILIIGILFGLPAGRFVRFLSQNTLLVFLAHMPVRDWVTPLYYPLLPDGRMPGGWWRQVANFFVLFVGIALVSEALRRGLRIARLREWAASKLFVSNKATPSALANHSFDSRK
jgi:hypothetical protein